MPSAIVEMHSGKKNPRWYGESKFRNNLRILKIPASERFLIVILFKIGNSKFGFISGSSLLAEILMSYPIEKCFELLLICGEGCGKEKVRIIMVSKHSQSSPSLFSTSQKVTGTDTM